MKIRNLLIPALMCLSLALSPSHLHAIPAYPYPFTVTQKDGSVLTVRLHGDEFFGYATTADGYNICQSDDGYYYYASTTFMGTLTPTKVRAKDAARRTAADLTALRNVSKGVARSLATTRSGYSDALQPMPAEPNKAVMRASENGEKFKSLVILVNFSDMAFTVQNPQQAFSDMLNKDGYSDNNAEGSAWNYYNDNSNGRFDPQFDVCGPYTLPQDMAYYGAPQGTSHDSNPRQMVVDACRAASAAGVDFSQYADDGIVRDIFIFFAGHNQAEGAGKNAIWPHRWSLGTQAVTLNGVTVDGYACTSEYKGAAGSIMAGIGTFCHEYGHVMGWPDFYDTDSEENGTSAALGSLSLMSGGPYNNGGRTPAGLTAIERWMLDWCKLEDITVTADLTLEPVNTDKAYAMETDTRGEFFVIENRQGDQFKWDAYIGGSGLAVYHVDRSSNMVEGAGFSARLLWDFNSLNAYSAHECMKVVKASGVEGYDTATSAWFFPGRNNVTSLSSSDNSMFKMWSGKAMPFSLSNIKANTTTASFHAEVGTSAAIVGKVSDRDGKGLADVTVWLSKIDEKAAAGVATRSRDSRFSVMPVIRTNDGVNRMIKTDASGAFEVQDMELGDYSILFAKAGYLESTRTITLGLSGATVNATMRTPAQNTDSKVYWYKNEAISAIGLTDHSPFTAAALFEYADINLSGSLSLESMDIFLNETCNTTARVYLNNHLVQSIPVSPKAGEWLNIDLKSYNIIVNAGDDVAVGYTVADYKQYPASIDGVGGVINGSLFAESSEPDVWDYYDGGHWMIAASFKAVNNATGVEFTKQSYTAVVGDEQRLDYRFIPVGTTAPLSWSCNVEGLVTIDDGGIVCPLRAGSGRISAKAAQFSAPAECDIQITDEIKGDVETQLEGLTDITISWQPAVERATWCVRWKNQYDTDYFTTETSSTSLHLTDIVPNANYEIRVGGKRTYLEYWGEKSASIATGVSEGAQRVDMTPTETVLMIDNTVQLSAKTYPEDVYNNVLVWSSDKPEVASVDESGLVTGRRSGVAVITARTKYGDKQASCTVTVKNVIDRIETDAIQNDVVLSWDTSLHSGAWGVRWYLTATPDNFSMTQVDEGFAVIGGLLPASDYTAEVFIVTDDNRTGVPESASFATRSLDKPFPAIYLPKSTFALNEPIVLRVINVQTGINSVKWRLDGNSTTDLRITPSAGQHTIAVTVNTEDGAAETITKIITVK